MDFEKFSDKLKEIFINALTLVKDNKHVELDLCHLLIAFIKTDDIRDLLESLKVDLHTSTIGSTALPKIWTPKGLSNSQKSSFLTLFTASRIKPSAEMNSEYTISAPNILHT